MAPSVVRVCSCVAAALLLCLSAVYSQSDPAGMVAYDEKFIVGVRNYAMRKWSDAIIHLGQAMEEYDALEAARLECFTKCQEEGVPDAGSHADMTKSQLFFYVTIQRKHCIRWCLEDALGLLPSGGMASHVLRQLKRKDGYNYLQVAYYNEGKLKEAARACSTFKYHNPLNQQILKDLAVYKNTKGVGPEDMQPISTIPYRESYAEGHRLYYTDDWAGMVRTFEQSLLEFYKALEECRILCDGPLKYQDNLEFPQVIGKLALKVQECRVQCVRVMGEFRNDQKEDFFGSYFHYLQRGYHKLNQSLQALQASAAQVRLEPTTKMPQRNSVFYLRQPGVTRKDFAPRKDVVKEVEKRENDMKFLSMLKRMLGADHTKEDKADAEGEDGTLDQTLLDEDFHTHPPVGVAIPSQDGSSSDDSTTFLPDHIQPVVVQTPDDFGGVERAVFDQVLSENECQDLIHLASYGHEGDGYTSKSPHTFKEKFEGLHILEAAERSSSGEFDRHLTWLYLNYSRVAKDLVAKQFDLLQPLYFSYTHLVCRTALEGKQGDRSDLSHPVHSDNCILDEAHGVCRKEAPAYTWRDYSAILYLNGDFEGGDFFFAKSVTDLTPDVRVKPRCGRLVGFSAGQENLHGVLGVTKGRRCAIALWFTLDSDHKEHTFDTAETLLTARSS